MAYSTQKEFFHVPFMSEDADDSCGSGSCGRLKRYESTTDDRAWHMNPQERSMFLEDLVKNPSCGPRGETSSFDINKLAAEFGIAVGDSLLNCANKNFNALDELLSEKQNLRKKLEISCDHLSTTQEENVNIKKILNQQFDHGLSVELQQQVQQLSLSGKLEKSDENALSCIYCRLEGMIKAYEIFSAEKGYLQRLLDKLSRRANIESIPIEPETSLDTCYLLGEVNHLRREVIMLRQLEDEYLKKKQALACVKRATNKDVERVRRLMQERDALKQRVANFKEHEAKLRELQQKAAKADNLCGNLNSNLEEQTQLIKQMEAEMDHMRQYYEDKLAKQRMEEELLKLQLQEIRDELARTNCRAQDVEIFQMEIGILRNEVLKREKTLSDLECNHKQLMYKTKRFQICGYRVC